jgi:DNA-binding MarR family transcriptional regulator
MTTFRKLRELRLFQRRQLPSLRSIEDFDVVLEIGYHQELGDPLTLKRLFLQNVGSVATVQRRLGRLKRLGIVLQKRSEHDRRNLELMVSPAVRRLYRRMGRLLAQGAVRPTG